jgi:NAD-dependent SIR2 family protein deacetylase
VKCIICEEEFNPNSKEKKRAGGKINNCPSCSEETTAKALGFASGDGKMASISILKFNSTRDAEIYKEYWARASGLRQGKVCSMHKPGLTAPSVEFRTVHQSTLTNHKGKST